MSAVDSGRGKVHPSRDDTLVWRRVEHMRGVVLMAATMVACLAPGTYGQPAPSTNYTSMEADPSKPLQVGYYAQAHKDCTPSKLPIVHVVEAPTLGTLTVRPSELKTGRVPNCPSLTIPAQVVSYQARAKVTGSDRVMYSVSYPNGEIALYDVTIQIKEPPPKENKL